MTNRRGQIKPMYDSLADDESLDNSVLGSGSRGTFDRNKACQKPYFKGRPSHSQCDAL